MNRSVERHRLRVCGVRPGEVVVSGFDHPTRGFARCAAAPLVAGELRRRGWRVREESGAIRQSHAGDSVLFAVTYLDRSGDTVGFAAAANHRDRTAVAAAAETVKTWRCALRTRRLLLAAIDPSCDGARRARQLIGLREGTLYVLGRSPELESPDLADTVTVRDLDEVPPAATVVFPPFGVPAAVRAEAAARGLTSSTPPARW